MQMYSRARGSGGRILKAIVVTFTASLLMAAPVYASTYGCGPYGENRYQTGTCPASTSQTTDTDSGEAGGTVALPLGGDEDTAQTTDQTAQSSESTASTNKALLIFGIIMLALGLFWLVLLYLQASASATSLLLIYIVVGSWLAFLISLIIGILTHKPGTPWFGDIGLVHVIGLASLAVALISTFLLLWGKRGKSQPPTLPPSNWPGDNDSNIITPSS